MEVVVDQPVLTRSVVILVDIPKKSRTLYHTSFLLLHRLRRVNFRAQLNKLLPADVYMVGAAAHPMGSSRNLRKAQHLTP